MDVHWGKRHHAVVTRTWV
jgi:hypothetical protein